MDSFRKNVKQFLWEEVFGRNTTRPKEFAIKDAWEFFMENAHVNKEVDSCVINIEPKGDRYDITQLMLDRAGNILKADKDSYIGRRIIAESIDPSVTKYMNGETRKTMRLPE